jgi:hypothetical protein
MIVDSATGHEWGAEGGRGEGGGATCAVQVHDGGRVICRGRLEVLDSPKLHGYMTVSCKFTMTMQKNV